MVQARDEEDDGQLVRIRRSVGSRRGQAPLLNHSIIHINADSCIENILIYKSGSKVYNFKTYPKGEKVFLYKK